MDNQIQEKYSQILDFILTSLNQTKDFVIAQAPDVVKQMLEYDFISCIFKMMETLIPLFLLFIVLLWVRYSIKKKLFKTDDGRDEIGIPNIVFSSMAVLILTVISIGTCAKFIDSFKTMTQIKYTPKAYLINKYVGDKK